MSIGPKAVAGPPVVEMQGHLLSGSGLFWAGWQAEDGRATTALLGWVGCCGGFL